LLHLPNRRVDAGGVGVAIALIRQVSASPL
jgi:hypothetical protein